MKAPKFLTNQESVLNSFYWIKGLNIPLILSTIMLLNFEIIKAQSIATGTLNSLAIDDQGKLYAWGSKQGSMTYDTWVVPEDFSTKAAFAGKRVKQASGGTYHSVALTTEGLVYAWGDNEYGQLGNNGTEESFEPIQVPNLTDIVEIAASNSSTLALKSDGTVYMWGEVYSETSPFIGKQLVPVLVEGLTDVVAICTESGSSLALKSDGTVYGWGVYNDWMFGDPMVSQHTPKKIEGLENITAISIGQYFALALDSNGQLYSWGIDEYGYLGRGQHGEEWRYEIHLPDTVHNLGRVVAFDAGYYHVLAVLADGSVWAWGLGTTGRLGNGKIHRWDDLYYESLPVQIKDIPKITKVSAESNHSLLLQESGIVYAFGESFFGQLGVGQIYLRGDFYASPLMVKNLDLVSNRDFLNGVYYEKWEGINGGIENIPLGASPASVKVLNMFEAPANSGNNYGSRIRGYIFPPETGEYTFYISSDDESELWLSPTSDPAARQKIAFVNGNTGKRQWNKYPSQKSVKLLLNKDKKYYVEVLHKEDSGADHVAVAWQLPGGSMEGPVSGTRLAPYISDYAQAPQVKITSPLDSALVFKNSPVTLKAEASYVYGKIKKVEFYDNRKKVGEDSVPPYSLVWMPDEYFSRKFDILALAVTEDGNIATASIVLNVVDQPTCASSGSISWEQWIGLPSGGVSVIPVSSPPSNTQMLSLFEASSNIGNNYGARVRGLICPPQSGFYTFFVASDDQSELWLSSDSNPENKSKIAFVNGVTSARQWNKYPSQKSAEVYLTAGSSYYIEALHKENSGADHFAVGWQLPDGTFDRPVSGSHLSPYPSQNINMAEKGETIKLLNAGTFETSLKIFPNPFSTDASVQVTSSGSKDISVTIYDLRGNVVENIYEGPAEKDRSYEFKINRTTLIPGIYICRLKQGSDTRNYKIIKM